MPLRSCNGVRRQKCRSGNFKRCGFFLLALKASIADAIAFLQHGSRRTDQSQSFWRG
jgi:hypothetical protein